MRPAAKRLRTQDSALVHAQRPKTTQYFQSEGECAKCGKAITRRKKHCQGCQIVVAAEKEEQERRRRENYQSWLTPAGKRRAAPVKNMQVKTVFRAGTPWVREKLSGQSPTRVLVDHLIGICYADTPYLRKQDAMRYVSLLNELRETEFQDWSHGAEIKTTVGRTSIERLPGALRQWVNSYFADDHHPMMPAYAMDTARFIEFHVHGHEMGEWSVEALLPMPMNDRLWSGELFDRSFRRFFTMQFGVLVGCQVPNSVFSIQQPDWIEPLKSGMRFLFRIERCHLSESLDQGFVVCDDTDLQYDLMSEFCFTGKIILERAGKAKWVPLTPNRSLGTRERAGMTVSASVSGRWVTHALVCADGQRHLRPVPRWSLDGVGDVSQDVQ